MLLKDKEKDTQREEEKRRVKEAKKFLKQRMTHVPPWLELSQYVFINLTYRCCYR